MIAHDNLPSSKSSSLNLAQPSKNEIQKQLAQNGIVWRGALSFEAYLRREEYLSSQGIAKASGLTSWILVDTALKPDDRTILAGCESLRKRALISSRGKVEEVICHGVCSVFSAPEFRRRGYAGRMIEELGKKLETWQVEDKPCLLSVLYSDIGKKFYAAHGWHPFHSAHVHIGPRDTDPTTQTSSRVKVRPLYAEDMAKLCALDETLTRKRLARWNGDNTAVALICDHATVQWHHAREEFVANELLGKKPMIKGAVADVNGHRVWCIWSRVWANENPSLREGNVLHIIRLVVEDDNLDYQGSDELPEHIAGIVAVLRFASQQAFEWHMQEVELWNPQPRSLLAAQQLDNAAKVIHRDHESVTSLRWYGDEEDQIEWLENEKYGWC